MARLTFEEALEDLEVVQAFRHHDERERLAKVVFLRGQLERMPRASLSRWRLERLPPRWLEAYRSDGSYCYSMRMTGGEWKRRHGFGDWIDESCPRYERSVMQLDAQLDEMIAKHHLADAWRLAEGVRSRMEAGLPAFPAEAADFLGETLLRMEARRKGDDGRD